MHTTTSPSDFIYRRPFGSAPAVVGLGFNNTDKLKSDEARDSPDRHHTCELTHTATAAFNCRHSPPQSGPSMLASKANAEQHLGALFLKSDAPSPSPCNSQPTGRPVHGHSFFPAQSSTECILQIPCDGAEPIVWHPLLDTKQVWQESGDNQNGDKRASNASESTMYRTSSSHSWESEQTHRICAAVGAAYDICLDATKTYLSSHHANLRARTSCSDNPDGSSGYDEFRTASACKKETDHGSAPDFHTPSRVGSSYPPGHNHHGAHQDQPLGPIPPTSTSLLKNISGICNMLWTGSQRDRLAVLNVERMAVDNMAQLLSWAETIALGDYDEWILCDEDALRSVLDAGKSLCAWLGVLEAVREMEDLEERLTGVQGDSKQDMGNRGGVWEV